jgi:hypothetical protein
MRAASSAGPSAGETGRASVLAVVSTRVAGLSGGALGDMGIPQEGGAKWRPSKRIAAFS